MNRSLTAGIFYPSEPQQLKDLLSSTFLECSDQIPLPGALLIPHAAYEYVLPLYERAFSPFVQSEPERIIILAPLHAEVLHEDTPKTIFIPSFESITTPLGEVTIDQDLCEQLDGVHQLIGYGDHYFDEETAIELALPPIQQLFGNTPILPLLVGDVSAKTAAVLSSIITPLIDEKTLVIISMNLTGWERRELIETQQQTLRTALASLTDENRPHLIQMYRDKKITSCGTTLLEALHRSGLCKSPWHLSQTYIPDSERLVDDTRTTAFAAGYLPLELPHES